MKTLVQCSKYWRIRMQSYYNNAYFWQKVDTLYFSSKLVIAYEKGDSHKDYKNLIYPVQYGYLSDLVDDKDLGIAVYRGSKNSNRVDALIIAADILKKDLEPKLLIGCTESEEMDVLHFLNQTDLQKTILVRRGQELPAWATTD